MLRKDTCAFVSGWLLYNMPIVIENDKKHKQAVVLPSARVSCAKSQSAPSGDRCSLAPAESAVPPGRRAAASFRASQPAQEAGPGPGPRQPLRDSRRWSREFEQGVSESLEVCSPRRFSYVPAAPCLP